MKDQTTPTTKIEQIKNRLKNHLKTHKVEYCTAGGVLVGMGIGGAVMANVDTIVIQDAFRILSPSKNHNILEITKPGNSGDILWDKLNETHYYSRNQAAQALGKTRQAVAKDIANGHLELVLPGDVISAKIA